MFRLKLGFYMHGLKGSTTKVTKFFGFVFMMVSRTGSWEC